MNLGIEGRVALVVGASKGLGLEIARELKAEGCRVYTVSRTGQTDFNMDLMAQGATDLLITGLTLTPPDIIVHVLGGSQGLTGTLLPSTDWARVWRLNLGIAHDLNAAFIPLMQRNKWGRIIHISSNATRIGSGYCPYTSAKAALEGYVKSVSREFSKDGVIITAVSPGIVYTPGRYFASLDEREQEEYFNKYIPTHRFGRAEEVAKTVAFLASEHSAYMAGSVVSIDGGAR
jgi:3-oxoacyl-[acyl-carrier protein] reductase